MNANRAWNLIRWAGLSAAVAGSLFIIIQPLHPPEVLSSVTTPMWAIVHFLSVAMTLFGLFGVAGIYARQVEESGWLGLAGFLLLTVWLALTTALTFAEAAILPLLATDVPKFVQGYLALSGGSASPVPLGALALVAQLSGLLYLLGGLLLGIATFRAGILPRWAGGLLAFGAAASLAAALLPHELVRIVAVPVGLALIWLGVAVWSQRREGASEPLPGRASRRLRQTGAE